ncbi:MAG: phosphatidylserine decarboxylase [Acidimicrobiia bacterium]|nr:phosphatidylserine decarboxylase [Acidimicrobiia bacterium]
MVITGIYYAIGLVAGGLVVSYFTRPWLGVPFYILAAFCLYFFRDPERVTPQGPYAISPADGKVVAVVKETETRTRVSIFLNVFDVHVNRSPIAGKITKVDYKEGKFLVASKEEASTDNEQNTVTLVAEDGTTIVFKQIAGLVARRIVFWKSVGDQVKMGERVGLIKFGSRMDVLLGPEWQVGVKEGERVEAGASILARRKG